MSGSAHPASSSTTARTGIPAHAAKGDLVVHCLEGRVGFTAGGKTHDLAAGHLLCLPAGEPHSVRGVEAGSLLLTVVDAGPRLGA